MWVNHRYRILYLRHAKTASSSLLCHFKGCGGAANASTGGGSSGADDEGGAAQAEASFKLLPVGSLCLFAPLLALPQLPMPMPPVGWSAPPLL